MHDDDFFDVPNGHRDADLEMAALEAAGRQITMLRKRGICTHGWLQGPPGSGDGKVHCNHCGAIFATMDIAWAAHEAAMNG